LRARRFARRLAFTRERRREITAEFGNKDEDDERAREESSMNWGTWDPMRNWADVNTEG